MDQSSCFGVFNLEKKSSISNGNKAIRPRKRRIIQRPERASTFQFKFSNGQLKEKVQKKKNSLQNLDDFTLNETSGTNSVILQKSAGDVIKMDKLIYYAQPAEEGIPIVVQTNIQPSEPELNKMNISFLLG